MEFIGVKSVGDSMPRWKHDAGRKHIEIHELNTGYVVEYNTSAHSFLDLEQVVKFILILEPDEEKRKKLSAQIGAVFESENK